MSWWPTDLREHRFLAKPFEKAQLITAVREALNDSEAADLRRASMDINLILSAQTLSLSPQLQKSELINGLFVIKNIPLKTYLRVTPEQWVILQLFEKPQTVPVVLGGAIRDRQCLPLDEFYELILKALRANILREPGTTPTPVKAYEWSWGVRPSVMARPVAILFCVGLVMALAFRPALPTSPIDWIAGILLLSASLCFGTFLRACLIRGGGGEVYRPQWKWMALPPYFTVDMHDAIMLPASERMTVGIAGPCGTCRPRRASRHGTGRAWRFSPWSGSSSACARSSEAASSA